MSNPIVLASMHAATRRWRCQDLAPWRVSLQGGATGASPSGTVGNSLFGPYDAGRGDIVCRDANSLRFRMSCWTGFWAARTPDLRWPMVACWKGSRRRWPNVGAKGLQADFDSPLLRARSTRSWHG